MKSWILAAVVYLLGLWGFYEASVRADGGEFTFALDDSYIHLAIARTLLDHGVWGISPLEWASASSSPAFTFALAAALGLLGRHEWVALVLNAVAGLGVLWALRARLHAPSVLGVALALGPLPYLGALGMEHVAHLLAVLLLVDATLAGRIRVAMGMAALATLLRYESFFVATALGLVLASERRVRDGVLVIASALVGIGVFGAWMWSHGGLPIPNSLVMKSALAGGWVDLWRSNAAEGAGVLALVVAALATAGANREDRREAMVFSIAALLHLGLARMGWLFRYEGYLVVWGCAVVLPALWRFALPVRAGLALALLFPLGLRAGSAIVGYVPAAEAIHDSDRLLARALASVPGLVPGVHNVGVLAWETDIPIVDLAGLGTNDVARWHLRGELDAERFGRLLGERGANLVYVDSRWLSATPPGLTPLATLEYAVPTGGRARTLLYSTERTDRGAVRQALGSIPDGAERYRLEWSDAPQALDVPLASVQISGAAVVREEQEIAFYSGGEARFRTAASGTFSLALRGTPANGAFPVLHVVIGETVSSFDAASALRSVTVGPVSAGAEVVLRYSNDEVDAEGNDRNLWIGSLRLTP